MNFVVRQWKTAQKTVPRRRCLHHLAVLLLCSLALLPCSLLAQVDQGTITGVIQDASGATVAKAVVTVTDTDTGLVLERASDASGLFTFSPLKIGNYEIRVTAEGFEAFTQKNLHLDVSERLNVPVQLKPGEVSETVTVDEAPPLLETQSSSTGQVISTQAINNTPLNGRNWVYIAQLTAGVAPAFSGTRGGGTGDYYANGQRAEQNNFILDGVDNNTNLIDFLNGASYVVRPPPDALAEFEIHTADYSAEFGHSAGSVINASVKSGTNQFHGDMWEYFRNTDLDARNWNAVSATPYHQNQFGATLGGPLLKGKLFYFGDMEVNRIAIASPSVETVPTALMRQGNFSELLNTSLTGASGAIKLYEPNSGGTTALNCNNVNNSFCTSQIDPVAQAILNLYPMPNTNGGKTYSNYIVNINTNQNTVQWDQRLDWNISSKDQTFLRYSYLNAPSNSTLPLGTILDGSTFGDGRVGDHAENVAASETHIFSPTLTNEFRFGYSWGIFNFLQSNANTDVSQQLGLGGVPFGPGYPDNGGLPQGVVTGITAFGAPQFEPAVESQNVYQILDNVSVLLGKHSVRAGVSLQAIRFAANQPPASRGVYNYTGKYTRSVATPTNTGYGVADFLANQMNSTSISNDNTLNDSQWYRSAYVQDDWRLFPTLTINLGLRYDYFQPYKEDAGLQANLVPTSALGIGSSSAVMDMPLEARSVPIPAQLQQLFAKNDITIQYLSNPALVTSQKKNFAPRVGFAEQINPRLTVHGGFGLFYGGLQNQGATNLGNNAPFQIFSSVPTPSCSATTGCPSIGITLENGLAAEMGQSGFISTPQLEARDQFQHTPYTMDYNLSVQHAFTTNMVAEVAYVGNVSRHLSDDNNWDYSPVLLNPCNSTQPYLPFPGFSGVPDVNFVGISSYNSLQAKLEKRASHGLSFSATYTLAHALDDTTDSGGGLEPSVGGRDPRLIPVRDEYTTSAWDQRQRVTLNGNYELPFGVGRAYLSSHGLVNEIVGGWSTSLTFVAQTGPPFKVSPNITTAAGAGTARANLIRDPFKGGGTPDPTLGYAAASAARPRFARARIGTTRARLRIRCPGATSACSMSPRVRSRRRLSLLPPGFRPLRPKPSSTWVDAENRFTDLVMIA
jgi:hypothetical protein